MKLLQRYPPVDVHLIVQRAEQLAAERPLAAGLAGGVAHVRLEAGSGPTWRMSHLACPVDATVEQLAEVRMMKQTTPAASPTLFCRLGWIQFDVGSG